MRAEYSRGGPQNEQFVALGSESWLQEDRPQVLGRSRGAAAEKEHLSSDLASGPGAAERTAPYVWHVKDGGHEAPPEIRAAVQRAWRPPYFVRGAVNIREANESSKFWFSRRKGSVLAHADTYCIPAVSLQITGRKHWRLMPPPAASVTDRPDSHDGGIYGTGRWQPAWEATVSEGEAIVFFPNIYHETYVPEEGNPECTVATTFQIQLPVPVRYLRAFLPTHVLSHLYSDGHGRELWHSYATLRPPHKVRPTLDEAAIEAQVSELLAAVDLDGDGQLSLQELEGYLAAQTEPVMQMQAQTAGASESERTTPTPPWPRWFFTEDYFYDWRPPAEPHGVRREMEGELLKYRAADTLAYLDTEGPDGLVSRAELLASLRQWHAVHWWLAEIEQAEASLQRSGGRSQDELRLVEGRFMEKYSAGRASQVRRSENHEL
ncbi:unnamed protein product [Polarella glacialis]|uniref:Calmodulin n=1 Tax=Polarella glacialis TaxID=89957 RepID=A0A813EKV1_POLGL|nr:unnamed protein product [Polarella glacialis]